MKVWYFFPYAGGPDLGPFYRPYELAREWAQTGIDTTVFVAQHHHQTQHAQLPETFYRDGVRYRSVPCAPYSGNRLARFRNMFGFTAGMSRSGELEAAQTGRPDAIVVSSPHPYPAMSATRLAKRYGASFVFEVRDIWPLSFSEILGMSRKHPVYRVTGQVERHAYKHANALVSVLPAAWRHMVARGGQRDKFEWIPNGAARDVSLPAKPSEPAALTGLTYIRECQAQGRRVLAYAGAMGPPNALDGLIPAIKALGQSASDRLALVLMGDGSERARVKRELASLGTSVPIRFTGKLTREDASVLLQQADAGFVLALDSPLYQFGISINKIFEYMRLSKPVLAAYRAANDPVGEANAGVVLEPGDPAALARALEDFAEAPDAQMAQWGGAGRTYFERTHAYDALAAKYARLLRRLRA
jgi:glycosyltransferase involved in cell wall biosynthesis